MRELMSLAYGQPYEISDHFVGNFKKGDCGARHLQKIYDWMRDEHPESAEYVWDKINANKSRPRDATLLDHLRHKSRWDDLVKSRGSHGQIDIRPLSSPPLQPSKTTINPNEENSGSNKAAHVGFGQTGPLSQQRIKMGDRFCFDLFEGHEGSIIALQFVQRMWLPMPLRPEGMASPLLGIPQSLPLDGKTRQPIGLTEESQPGRHHFVFLIGPSKLVAALEKPLLVDVPISADTREQLAKTLDQADDVWQMLYLNVWFDA